MQAKVFWVHNLYFTPTNQENYRVSAETLLDVLAQALEKEGEHILLTDSNLHHPSWSKSSQLYSELATKFKELTDDQGLELAIATFTPTRARTLAECPSSAIDLFFISISLLNSFISSQINLDFHTGSDHRPVQTILSLETPKKARTYQRNWRTLDLDQVKKEAKNLPPIPPLLNREGVDNYLENLDKALQELADKTTKPLRDSKYTVPWWNQEIKEKIKEERKLRRKVFQNQEPVYNLERVIKKKKHLIKNAKRKIFREQLQNLAETQKHWKIAKWGKEKAGKLPELPIVQELTKQDGETARTFTEKVEVFKTQFFPLTLQPVPESQDQPANHQHQLSQEISKEDIHNILKKKNLFTAPGKDTLTNGFLKVLGDSFNEKIAKVLEACWKLEYFPDRYKTARTICLRKSSKKSYCYAKAWRPIALLNTIRKLMEALAATKLSELAEKENLLPEIQMDFRKGRSTESVTSQVEKVWKEGMVASLLSLDISGAYDRVLPEILKKILERKGIPSWFVN